MSNYAGVEYPVVYNNDEFYHDVVSDFDHEEFARGETTENSSLVASQNSFSFTVSNQRFLVLAIFVLFLTFQSYTTNSMNPLALDNITHTNETDVSTCCCTFLALEKNYFESTVIDVFFRQKPPFLAIS